MLRALIVMLVVAMLTTPASAVRVTPGTIEILDTIYFPHRSGLLQKRSLPVVNAVAQTLKNYPDLQLIEVHGHCDPGEVSPKKAIALSQARADAVRAYLILQGVEAGRLVTVADGDTKPVVLGKRPDDRARNRRVEFKIVQRATP